MFLLSQTPAPPAPVGGGGGGALSTQRCSLNSALKFSHPIPPLFSTRRPPNFSPLRAKPTRKPPIFVVNPDANSTAAPKPTNTEADSSSSASLVGEETVPLEGVIQFEKPSFYTRIDKWG